MLYDLISAFRSLRRHPAFTLLAVLTLGLGIGATVTVFSVAEAVLFRSLPYPDAHQLVDLSHGTVGNQRLMVSRLDVPVFREQTGVFQGVGARSGSPVDITFQTGEGPPAHAAALGVSHDYLSVLGIQPFLGRGFILDDAVEEPEEEGREETEEAGPRSMPIILTYGLWQRALGGDPNIGDRTFRIADNPCRVIGVLPQSFSLLHERRHRWVRGTAIDLFYVLSEEMFTAYPQNRGRNILPLARTRPGVSPQQAQAAMDVLSARLKAQVPQYEEEEMRVQVFPLREDLTTGTRPILLVLSGGVLFLMLLVSANLATLMLVRGRTRFGEDAIRATVGCGRGRLLRGKVMECVLLVTAGSLLGSALAWAAIRLVRAMAPPTIPLIDQVSLNTPVLLLALGAAFLLVLFSGTLSALQLGRLSLVRILKSDAPGGSGEGRQRLMNSLVIGELALSMVLLAGAAVMLRTLQEMNRADYGFQAERVLTFDILLYAEDFRSQETRRGLVREIKEGIEALPGVEGLARSSMPPLSGTIWNRIYGWDQEILDRGTERADLTVSSQDYFRVMGTRLLAGRFFTPEEMTDSSSSIIVDEKLANMAWPGEDPIGKLVLMAGGGGGGVVVGVVEHMLMRDFGLESFEAVHYPEGNFWPPTRFVVRTALEPEALTPSIRRVLRSIHPTLVPFKIMSLSDRVSLSMAPTRFVVLLMGSFAAISFLVAVTGLFGVIAYAVRTRTAELGIRMALGADRAGILKLILAKGALLTGVGILGGLVGALALGRFIESMVFGVSPTNPMILGGAALVLGGVSILACCAPARWASRLPPAQVLRTQ